MDKTETQNIIFFGVRVKHIDVSSWYFKAVSFRIIRAQCSFSNLSIIWKDVFLAPNRVVDKNIKIPKWKGISI